MRKKIYLIITLLISGCSTSPPSDNAADIVIGKIRIDPMSKHSDGSAEMITRCSGFILSETEVRNFLIYASRFKDQGPDKYYRILPCSATGSAVINRRKYSWVIRAGGIGEFSTGKDRFIAVCGKKCCEKLPGIC